MVPSRLWVQSLYSKCACPSPNQAKLLARSHASIQSLNASIIVLNEKPRQSDSSYPFDTPRCCHDCQKKYSWKPWPDSDTSLYTSSNQDLRLCYIQATHMRVIFSSIFSSRKCFRTRQTYDVLKLWSRVVCILSSKASHDQPFSTWQLGFCRHTTDISQTRRATPKLSSVDYKDQIYISSSSERFRK